MMVGHYVVTVILAGSGCGIAASQLLEDPAGSALLLEAGPNFPIEPEMLLLFAGSSDHI